MPQLSILPGPRCCSDSERTISERHVNSAGGWLTMQLLSKPCKRPLSGRGNGKNTPANGAADDSQMASSAGCGAQKGDSPLLWAQAAVDDTKNKK